MVRLRPPMSETSLRTFSFPSATLALLLTATAGLMARDPNAAQAPLPEVGIEPPEARMMGFPRGAMLMVGPGTTSVRIGGVVVPIQRPGEAGAHWLVPMNQPLGVQDVLYEAADGTTTLWAFNVLPDAEPGIPTFALGGQLWMFRQPTTVRLDGVPMPFHPVGDGWNWTIPPESGEGVAEIRYEFADGTFTTWALDLFEPWDEA